MNHIIHEKLVGDGNWNANSCSPTGNESLLITQLQLRDPESTANTQHKWNNCDIRSFSPSFLSGGSVLNSTVPRTSVILLNVYLKPSAPWYSWNYLFLSIFLCQNCWKLLFFLFFTKGFIGLPETQDTVLNSATFSITGIQVATDNIIMLCFSVQYFISVCIYTIYFVHRTGRQQPEVCRNVWKNTHAFEG